MGRACRGFTLIELLVVMMLIALLISILVPVLGKVHEHARMVRELAASRQIQTAYELYSAEHRGWLLPGHLKDSISLHDDRGEPISPAEVSRRWPWRLAGYTDHGLRGSILIGEQASLTNQQFMRAYMISIQPSFGLNYYNLGGDLASVSPAAPDGLNMPGWVRRTIEVQQPSRMTVFASAGTNATIGDHEGGGVTHGYWSISPPTRPYATYSGWLDEPYSDYHTPLRWGFVHGRWGGAAVVSHLDGHSELMDVHTSLRDMTRWSSRAAELHDPGWVPPSP